MILSAYGFTPDTANDGVEAVQMYEANLIKQIDNEVGKDCTRDRCMRQGYHLIFMDINMPNKDGVQASKEILAMQRDRRPPITHLPETQIVALTAYQD